MRARAVAARAETTKARSRRPPPARTAPGSRAFDSGDGAASVEREAAAVGQQHDFAAAGMGEAQPVGAVREPDRQRTPAAS